jgi:hypothetical protein
MDLEVLDVEELKDVLNHHYQEQVLQSSYDVFYHYKGFIQKSQGLEEY